MAKSLSMDIRERALVLVDEGLSLRGGCGFQPPVRCVLLNGIAGSALLQRCVAGDLWGAESWKTLRFFFASRSKRRRI